MKSLSDCVFGRFFLTGRFTEMHWFTEMHHRCMGGGGERNMGK